MSQLSFRLSDDFVRSYTRKTPDWGFKDAGGNSLGEITFLRTYSRIKENGQKEKWWEVCQRVIEGMFSIQKDWAKEHRLPWNDNKAQKSAQDAYDRMFTFKWTPPGRGLWVMGTPIVNELKNSAALQNCAFVSTASMTKADPSAPFAWMMEASMLGVGVGFDDKGADKDFEIHAPQEGDVYTIPDTREGWCHSVRLRINAYLKQGATRSSFDYSLIRPAGAPIKTFGGTAAGPDPLRKLHDHIDRIFQGRAGSKLTRVDVADIGNLIGDCVVSGNVRRSAELLIGQADDKEFLNLKNHEVFPERNKYPGGWGYMSNNSVEAHVGQDLIHIAEHIARNGEPGVVWMDVTRKYGRLADAPDNRDRRAAGFNPCAEQPLESYEMCTLVETYLNRHESVEDYQRTLKYAYLYAKTVTLLPTHWPETNAVMQRNRRIGVSMSGIANFADKNGIPTLKKWMDSSYGVIQRYDSTYSEWLCVRESIKTTTVKPSGTVSILAGESPGVHWSPGGEYYFRLLRFSKGDPMVPRFREAGYRIEEALENVDTTVVVYFPIHSRALRSERDVTIFEKAYLATTAQRFWADNAVSVTVSFDPSTEAEHIARILHMHEGSLKTISFLPQGEAYPQMPYTGITAQEYEAAGLKLNKINLASIYRGKALDAVGEAYCTTDVCELPSRA